MFTFANHEESTHFFFNLQIEFKKGFKELLNNHYFQEIPPSAATYNYIKARTDDKTDRLCNQDDQKADNKEHSEALNLQRPTDHAVNNKREEKAREEWNREIDDCDGQVVTFHSIPSIEAFL